MKALNPKFIHGFYDDLAPEVRDRVLVSLDSIPGDTNGRAALWEKFKRNEATLLFGRNEDGAMAFFVFFEIRTNCADRKEFFLSGAFALQSSHDLVETSFPQIENFAHLLNCGSIALSTSRRGLVKKVTRLPGWHLTSEQITPGEQILRKAL